MNELTPTYKTLERKDRIQFRIELAAALLITGIVCVAGLSNIFFATNDFYPYTSEGMGYLVKVRFFAESLSRGEISSWFPYCFNGTAVTQYDPPLPYWIMTPIYMLTQNIMLTYKINCILVSFIGGVGVWYFCRAYIGHWCGLFGAAVYCLQPYILKVLLSAGTLSQGPIIALLPWCLTAFLNFGKRFDARNFIACTLFCSLMILSQAGIVFLIVSLTLSIVFIFVVLRKISMTCFLYMILSVVFAIMLTAFWLLVGATGLENPTLPVVDRGLSFFFSADWSWFLNLSPGWHSFALPVTVGSILAMLLYFYRRGVEKAGYNENYYILFCILLTVLAISFSFGLNLPFFKYLPMAEYLLAARSLILASVTGAILCAYLIFWINKLMGNQKISIKVFAFALGISVTGTSIYFMNPLEVKYPLIIENTFDKISAKESHPEIGNFEKGRYSNVGTYDSNEFYFPIIRDYNITEGWNIEGTPHYQTYKNFQLAISSDNPSFIAKNLALWNVRSILAPEDYKDVIEVMRERYSFQVEGSKNTEKFYISDEPSEYFLTDRRNALIMGAGSSDVAIEFPYLVQGKSNDITDYTLDELKKYKLIYLCSPDVATLQDKERIEAMVENLVGDGATIIIEPAIAKGNYLFDVTVADVNMETKPTIKKQFGSWNHSDADDIELDKSPRYGKALFGLDTVGYKLMQNNGTLENDVIGSKKTGKGDVVFIGSHLSQYLKAVFIRNWGMPDAKTGFPDCSGGVKRLFEDIFTSCGVNKDFWPKPFQIEKADWNYKGVDFSYSSQTSKEMTLSVTYTPRWKATLDGNPIQVGQKENLITLDLPAGDHEVKLVYGLTKYGIAGYIISLFGLFFFVLFLKFYDIILYHFRQICTKICDFLQLDYK